MWGTDWSNAYPGLTPVRDSPIADGWSQRLGRPMSEIGLETDRFMMRLVFHSVLWRKLSDDTGTVAEVHIPLDP